MMVSEWLYAAIALLVGLHVLTMLYAYRHRGDPTGVTGQNDADTSGTNATEAERSRGNAIEAERSRGNATEEERSRTNATEDDTGTVSCPHCGTSNERGYQFCRECVADLTGGRPQRQPTDRSQPH